MGEKIVVGPMNRGLRNDRTAFVIDNDSFPKLINAYQWRGRVKRKRGTAPLVRLTRFFSSLSPSYNSGSTTIMLAAITGSGNLLTGFSLQANGNIVPGSVTITVGVNIYTDPAMDGTLSPSGTINYATGAIAIPVEAGNAASAVFRYYPDLPVMGLEDFVSPITAFEGTIGFDTIYSYNIITTIPFDCYDVSFYKNPSISSTLPGYTPKTNPTPTSWNGQDYQQFWTTNYQGSMWTTNGITIPYTSTNVGMQYKAVTGVAIITAGNGTTIPAVADITIVAHGLVQGDFLFFNEIQGITGINFQTGYVTSADPQAANTVRVTFPIAILGGAYTTGGIAQYLTNRSDKTVDCLRFYDGDPTNSSPITPILNGNKGWVNFAPPLSQSNFSVGGLVQAQYYLVGARMITEFKDRLIFLGPVVQTSQAGSQIYLKDTVVYSQNGTAYYTASFPDTTGFAVTSPTTVFSPVLVPVNQTATPPAYFGDDTGFGGFITIGTSDSINSVSSNEDVLIVGLTNTQTKMVYSGNDIVPFNFYLINSEYGTASTFSSINLDEGVMSSGSRGYVITNQNQAKRFDLEIPDQIFQINLLNNGQQRVCSQRDFINEWVYFTYPSNEFSNGTPTAIYKFPTQTLQYNYRDNSWGIFNECFTTYGGFKQSTGFTWATIGMEFPSWRDWNEPWNAGSTTVLQPQVIAGNQQGFVVFRDSGTDEVPTLTIQAISGSVITSVNHCLNVGDYIIITGAIGTIASEINGKIFSVDSNGSNPITDNTFVLNPLIGAGTYSGGGVITRMYVPEIQSKQFPVAWGTARKTRLGVQQYLFTKTSNSQVTLQIFLSQNGSDPYNESNDALVNSSVLYTCPESTNIGLTPANINLQMVTGNQQAQIWHRKNISLIGDTVQIGITMSDVQMRNVDLQNQFAEIELHGFILDVNPSQVLA